MYILGRAIGRLAGHRQTLHPMQFQRSCGAAARIAAAIVLEDGVGRLAPIGHTAALEMVAARLMKSQRIHSTSYCTVAAANKRQGSVVDVRQRHAVSRAASLVGACVLFRSRRFVVSGYDHHSIRVHRVIHRVLDNAPKKWLGSVGRQTKGRTELGSRGRMLS